VAARLLHILRLLLRRAQRVASEPGGTTGIRPGLSKQTEESYHRLAWPIRAACVTAAASRNSASSSRQTGSHPDNSLARRTWAGTRAAVLSPA